jgi:hypothetical protein
MESIISQIVNILGPSLKGLSSINDWGRGEKISRGFSI